MISNISFTNFYEALFPAATIAGAAEVVGQIAKKALSHFGATQQTQQSVLRSFRAGGVVAAATVFGARALLSSIFGNYGQNTPSSIPMSLLDCSTLTQEEVDQFFENRPKFGSGKNAALLPPSYHLLSRL